MPQSYPAVSDLNVASQLIRERVLDKLQNADEIGGPDTPLEYIKLMSHLAGECVERAQICAYNNSEDEDLRRANLPPILVPRLMLSALLDMAREQVEDIESGISEGIYCAEENLDIGTKRQMVNLAEKLYRQATMLTSD